MSRFGQEVTIQGQQIRTADLALAAGMQITGLLGVAILAWAMQTRALPF